MNTIDRLEEHWFRLAQEIREDEAQVAALSSMLNDKRERFKTLDKALHDIILSADKSEEAQKLIVDRLDQAPLMRAPTRLSLIESVRRYVCESRNIDGVTAQEVAQALKELGYGGGQTWKNFYASVTMSLKRLVQRHLIEQLVFVQPTRTASRYVRPELPDASITLARGEMP